MEDPIGARFISSLILTVLYFYLYKVQDEDYLGIWGVAWLFYLNNYVIRILVPADSWFYTHLIFEINTLAITFCFLWGGYKIFGQRISPVWKILFVITTIWLILSFAYNWTIFGMPYGISSNLFFTLGTIYSGILIMKSTEILRKEKFFVGSIMILIGIINLAYPWTVAVNDYYNIEGHLALVTHISLAVSTMVMYFRTSQEKLKQLHQEHSKLLENIIQGFIPICSHCKAIREKDNSWTKLEHYVCQHADVTFSHGVCPDCLEQHFPDFTNIIAAK